MKAHFLYKLLISILLIGIACSCSLLAQKSKTSIRIDRIGTDGSGYLNLWVEYKTNGKLDNFYKRDIELLSERKMTDTVIEIIDTIQSVIHKNNIVSSTTEDSITIDFLLDVSNEMNPETLKQAGKIIRNIFDNRVGDNKAEFYLTTYSRDKKREKINKENINEKLKNLRSDNYPPDLYTAFIEEAKYLKNLSGNKVLFVVGSGENDTLSDVYNTRLPYHYKDVERLKQSLSGNFSCFAVGLKNNPIALSNLSYISDIEVSYLKGTEYAGYERILKNKIASNNQVPFTPVDTKFKGEKREYTIQINGETAKKSISLGSANFHVDLQQPLRFVDWLLRFLAGLLMIVILLLTGSTIIPLIREYGFKKKYVRRYIEEKNRVRNDPYYNIPIKHGTAVVDKCKQLIPFDTWKEIGWQCPNWPDCMNQNCSGGGAPDTNDFFSMEGIYLKLNWMLFGAIGGFLAWVLLSVAVLKKITGIESLVRWGLGEGFTGGTGSIENGNLMIQNLGNDLLLAIAAGTGLTF